MVYYTKKENSTNWKDSGILSTMLKKMKITVLKVHKNHWPNKNSKRQKMKKLFNKQRGKNKKLKSTREGYTVDSSNMPRESNATSSCRFSVRLFQEPSSQDSPCSWLTSSMSNSTSTPYPLSTSTTPGWPPESTKFTSTSWACSCWPSLPQFPFLGNPTWPLWSASS